ncbi:universal stress protein [Arenicella xantha]|uniref:Universal stress protein family protein n=1 Tax=Arenicella xantha TaxID=644221 RepID=A0A395JJQ6_9GAMM|nr:universal stress protein [Arenicella xantha]RBP50645.1 universal stress protein family protein [Arenicella xantha]
MRVILVPVADRPECMRALKVAFDIAGKLDANVYGCHIRAHSDSDLSVSADSQSASSIDTKAQDSTASVAAHTLFANIAESQHYSVIKKPKLQAGAVWAEKVGSPDKVLANIGPLADLIIVSRPKNKSSKLAQTFMQASLLNTARPVLVLPQSFKTSPGKCISIAWNQSAEAAQAVSAAMPLLLKADQVNIITCGSEAGIGPKSTQLASYLDAWGVKAKRIKASGTDDAKAILQAYQNINSDLLVMGAYSHSRLRQSIFGGVTDYMLKHANIPIFMLHS